MLEHIWPTWIRISLPLTLTLTTEQANYDKVFSGWSEHSKELIQQIMMKDEAFAQSLSRENRLGLTERVKRRKRRKTGTRPKEQHEAVPPTELRQDEDVVWQVQQVQKDEDMAWELQREEQQHRRVDDDDDASKTAAENLHVELNPCRKRKRPNRFFGDK